MSEEKKRILDLVRDGKVSVDEGLRLLEALDSSAQEGASASGRLGGSHGRMLRIRVLDTGDNTRVNVNIPLALAKVAIDQLLAAITESTSGKIVDVDSKDAKVEIYVE